MEQCANCKKAQGIYYCSWCKLLYCTICANAHILPQYFVIPVQTHVMNILDAKSRAVQLLIEDMKAMHKSVGIIEDVFNDAIALKRDPLATTDSSIQKAVDRLVEGMGKKMAALYEYIEYAKSLANWYQIQGDRFRANQITQYLDLLSEIEKRFEPRPVPDKSYENELTMLSQIKLRIQENRDTEPSGIFTQTMLEREKNELISLTTKVSDAENNLKTLKQEIENKNAKWNATTRKKEMRHKNEIDRYGKKAAELLTRIDEETKELSRIKRETKVENGAYTKLQEDKRRVEREISNKEKEKGELQIIVERIKAMQYQAILDMSRLDAEKMRLAKEIAEKKSELKEFSPLLSRKRGESRGLDEEVKAKTIESEVARNGALEKTKELMKIANSVKNAEDVCAKYRKDKEQLKAEIQGLEATKMKLRDEVAAYQACREKAPTLKQMIATLEANTVELKGEEERLQTSIANYEKTIADLTDAKTKASTDTEKACAEYQNWKTSLEVVKTETKEAEKKIAELLEQKSTLEKECQENAAIKEVVSKLKQYYSAKEKEWEQTQKALNVRISALEGENTKLENSLSGYMAKLESEAETWDKVKSDLESEKARFSEELKEFTRAKQAALDEMAESYEAKLTKLDAEKKRISSGICTNKERNYWPGRREKSLGNREKQVGSENRQSG